MKCYFDKNDNPRAEVIIRGLDREKTVSALIDTGCSFALMLSLPEAVSLGLKLAAIVSIELADGQIKKEMVFEAVLVDGKSEQPIEIVITSGESLLGHRILRNKRLTIDYPRHKIKLETVGVT